MGRWLSELPRNHGPDRWLVRARSRVAGIFLTALQVPPLCGFVSTLTSPEEFLAEYRALAAGQPRCPPARLAARLNEALRAIPGKELTPDLETREIECGCAVSLGLSSARIASLMLLSEGVVRNCLTGLYRKLGVAGREGAGALIEQAAFAPASSRRQHQNQEESSGA